MAHIEPHVFDSIPEVPVVFVRPNTQSQGQAPGVLGAGKQVGTPQCQVCRRPETDAIHITGETPEHEARWGL